uniref:Uncharacterized protein n=1 Tax=Steinernema glaseri TaxID=37863 RepID=A0A1I8AL25_9BILA
MSPLKNHTVLPPRSTVPSRAPISLSAVPGLRRFLRLLRASSSFCRPPNLSLSEVMSSDNAQPKFKILKRPSDERTKKNDVTNATTPGNSEKRDSYGAQSKNDGCFCGAYFSDTETWCLRDRDRDSKGFETETETLEREKAVNRWLNNWTEVQEADCERFCEMQVVQKTTNSHT